MPRVRHIQAVPIYVKWKEGNILGLRTDSGQIQKIGERNAGPFGDEGPTLFAGLMRNLRPRRKALQLRERETEGTGDQSIHRKPPIREFTGQQPLIAFVLGNFTASRKHFAIEAAVYFAID